MKIGINFHASDMYISGVEYYALGLLDGLLHIDSRNEYFVFTNQSDLVRTCVGEPKNLKIVGIRHLKTRIARIIWEHSRLSGLAEKIGLDVLHCVSYVNPLHKTKIPYIVTVHDTIAIDHPQWCKPTNALYFNLCMKWAIKKASCVIAVSKQTRDDLRRNFNVSSSDVRVICPGISTIFRPERNVSRESEVKIRYRLPEEYVLYVGNIEPKKNIGTLLCILKRIREEGLPHKLVIVGKRSWKSRVELVEIANGIKAGNIIMTGYVERGDLPFVYQMADVFLFPSLYEGFGFPPLEAMACGTPVVSSNSGALGETVEGAAMTFEPCDWQHMARAVISIITNDSLRREQVKKGIERSRLFSWEKAARETLSLYQSAVSPNRTGMNDLDVISNSQGKNESLENTVASTGLSYVE